MRRFAASLLLAVSSCASPPSAPRDGAPPPADADASAPYVPEPPLTAEATYVDLPATRDTPYPARMFTSFRPAEQDPAKKPLLVVFNGGPGAATSSLLLAYGTGPRTVSATGTVEANAHAFTRFANVLYIDSRDAGLSYGVGDPRTGCTFSMADDATDMLRALVALWDRHPSLRRAPIVLLGESYGGVRATMMMHFALHYTTSGLPFDLERAFQAHLDEAFPDAAGTVHPPERIATRFTAMALIQPLVLGQPQYDAQFAIMRADPYVGPHANDLTVEGYDVRQPLGYLDDVERRAAMALASSSSDLLGVDLATVPAFTSRGKAFRAITTRDSDVDKAFAHFGALGPLDSYFLRLAHVCTVGDIAAIDPNLFLDALRYVRVFITHARWDAVIYTPAIVEAFRRAQFPVTVDDAPRPGVARPGWIRVSLAAFQDEPARDVEIRFPPYDDSGHAVTVTQGADFADDLRDWLAGP